MTRISTPNGLQARLYAQQASVAARHVAEHLVLQPGPPGGVHPLDGSPDKRGAGSLTGSPSLAFSSGNQIFLNVLRPELDEPVGHRNLFERSPILAARRFQMVQPRRNLSISRSGGNRKNSARPDIDVSRPSTRKPVVRDPRIWSSVQLRVCPQPTVRHERDVIVPIPGDVAEFPGVGQAADVRTLRAA